MSEETVELEDVSVEAETDLALLCRRWSVLTLKVITSLTPGPTRFRVSWIAFS
jgi:hypothetical protein